MVEKVTKVMFGLGLLKRLHPTVDQVMSFFLGDCYVVALTPKLRHIFIFQNRNCFCKHILPPKKVNSLFPLYFVLQNQEAPPSPKTALLSCFWGLELPRLPAIPTVLLQGSQQCPLGVVPMKLID